MLSRKEEASGARLSNAGLLEYLPTLLESCKRLVDGSEMIFVNDRAPNKVAEVVVGSECLHHLCRYMALDSGKVDLYLDVE